MATDIITLGIACDSKDVVTASNNLDKLPGSAKRAEDATGSLGSKFAGLGKYIGAATAALAAFGLSSLAKECVDAALQMERLNKMFNAATGSAALAAKEMAFVRNTAQKLGLDVITASESYGKFLAAIRGTSLEGEKGRKVFESVSGAATALGLRADETSGIFNALQQMMSKGKVQAEELRGQLGERLPGAFRMAADAMGVSTAELDKMLAQGKVVADDLLPKLAVELDKTYGKAAVEGAHSAQAEINHMNNAMFDTKAAAGAALIPAFIDILKAMQPALEMIRSFIRATQEAGVYWGAFYDKVAAWVNNRNMAARVADLFNGGKNKAKYNQEMGNIGAAESAQMAVIAKQYQASTADYAKAMKQWQTNKNTSSGSTNGKTGKSNAKQDAERAANAVEQWRKTYSDLQIEIDKLDPALDDHAQKIADINNKYTDLERKKGANITKLEGLRIALIAATRAQWEASQAAEAHKLAMEEIDAAMTKYAAMKDKVDSSQPDFDLKQASDEMQLIVEDAIRFGDMVPGTIDKAANAVNRIASEYADKMVSYMRNAQQEAKELADIIRQNTVDEADLKASKAEDNAGFFGTGLVDAQLEAEKTAIHAKYEAERQAIQDQMDLINAKSTYEIEAIDRAHQAAMLAIETETRAKYADNKPMMDKALGEQAAAEKAYQSKLFKNRESDAKKTNVMLAALSKAFTLTQKKEQQAIIKVEQSANQQKLSMYADYAIMASSVLSQIADAQDQNSRKGFETAKAFNLAAAVVATAAGIMSAFSAPDNTTMAQKVAAAALVAATGAIQIAEIASTSYGSGGSVKAPSGSFNAGSSESSLGSTSGIGSMIGTQYSSVYDQQTQESLQALADSADNASLAIGKVADGLTSISSLFDDEGSYLSMAVGALPSSKLKYTSMGDTVKGTLTDVLLQTSKYSLNPLKLTQDLFTGKLFKNIGNVFSGIGKALFGGSWYTKSAGLALSMSGGDVDVDNYLYKKKDGGLFGKSKKKYVYSDNDVWTDIIQTTVDSIASTINHAAVAMGTTSNFSAASLGITRIKTTGRSEEDIAKDLLAWLESASNALAKTVVGLEEYTFYNENAFDALVRLATALQSSNEGLELIGATLIDSTLAGANAAYLLQELMGGAEEFSDAIDTYFSSMFSDAEQEARTAAQATRQVATAFGEMGVAVPETKEQFRQMVNALDLNTESGAAMFAALMDVSEAFGVAIDYAAEFAQSQKDLNDDARVRILTAQGYDDISEIVSMQIQHEQELRDAREQGLDVTMLMQAQTLELANAYRDQSNAAAELLRSNAIDALSSAYDVLETSVATEKKAIQSAYETASAAQQTIVSNLESSTSGLESLSKSLAGTISSLTDMTWAQAQSQIDSALSAAKRGSFISADSISTALGVLGSPNEDMYATLEDLNRDKGLTASKMAELKTLTDSQLTTEEQALEAAKAQLTLLKTTYTAEIARLDAILNTGQEQIDAINGTTAATLTVAQAMQAMASAYTAAKAATDAATASTSSSPTAFNESSYLAKYPDVAAAVADGRFLSGYQHYVMYGLNEGRSFAVGTNYVPYDMQANIHEGERIIPKADNYELIKRLDGGSGDNKELIDEIKALRAEIRASNQETAKNTKQAARILDKWDIDGMPAEAAA